MTEGSRRLIEAGFYNDSFKKKHPNWKDLDEKEKKEILDGLKPEEIEKYADHDEIEIAKDQMMLVDYPSTKQKYQLVYETPHQSIEPIYFWCLGHLKYDWGFPIIHKITDVFTAAQHSSFYGAAAQRLGLSQDKVTQFLATIGKMVRDMFQLVRELRIIDERLQYYEDSDKGFSGAEQALKGLWADMVDGVVGGQRTMANIFTMAQQLQFSSLPDLFFSIPITEKTVKVEPGKPLESLIDSVVEERAGGFNKQVRNILKRKLYQFVVWKKHTFKEHKQRKKFTTAYLRQHWNTIRLYTTWIKPYLRHIRQLGADISRLSKAELISAFEGSLIDIEILAQKIPEGNKKYYTCILMTFQYRTRPSLPFTQEGGFHRGPIHVGETTIFWRAYSWNEEQINNFIKMKEKEDFEMIINVDEALKSAWNALREDLEKYLEQAEKLEREKKEKEKKPPEMPGLLEPFKEVGKGFKELFGGFVPKKPEKKKPSKKEIEKEKKEQEKALKDANKIVWQNYKNFKKAHQLLTW